MLTPARTQVQPIRSVCTYVPALCCSGRGGGLGRWSVEVGIREVNVRTDLVVETNFSELGGFCTCVVVVHRK